MPKPGVFACSRPGTEGSNPPPSRGESAANLTPTMEHEIEVMPSYSMAGIGYPLSFMAFGKTRLKLLGKGSESPEDMGFQSRPRNQILRPKFFIHGLLAAEGEQSWENRKRLSRRWMAGITGSWQRNCVKLHANLARRERGRRY
jgi:hypothetical protein